MRLIVAGIGPGGEEGMTLAARKALDEAELIVGYTLYADLVRRFLADEKEYYTTPMRGERQRVEYAVKAAAEGRRTVLICSGDAGVYGMASLAFEEAERQGLSGRLEIQVLPGVTAALSGAALAGSPLSCDFAVISLSDLMVPWSVIEDRVRAAASGGLVLALYNPGSRKRTDHLGKACRIIREYREDATICAIAENIGRDGENCRYLTLKELEETRPGMTATVFVGNSLTRFTGGRMVTPRGYGGEYEERPGDDGTLMKGRDGISLTHSGEDDTGKRILLFGGTSEGRELAAFALEEGYAVTVSVATEYGEEVLERTDRNDPDNAADLRILRGIMPRREIEERLRTGEFFCVIDATHPYAARITESVRGAAASAGVPYYRVNREIERPGEKISFDDNFVESQGTDRAEGGKNSASPDREPELLYFPAMEQIIDYLNERSGRVFFSTGSGGAEQYARLARAKERAVIRILPSEKAIRKCRDAGFEGSNLICMQGPFDQEVNEACFRYAKADYLVTKSSGEPGGYAAKVDAARALGMKILVLQPPEEQTGFSLEEMKDFLKNTRKSGNSITSADNRTAPKNVETEEQSDE